MGEYGSFTSVASEEYSAASLSDQWQAEACEYGIDGFLYWTWDRPRTNSNNPDDPWGASDQGVFIGKVLSPQFKTTSCTVVTEQSNVALGKTTAASSSTPENPSDLVVDRKPTAIPWISGGNAPQWVEVDLGFGFWSVTTRITAIPLAVNDLKINTIKIFSNPAEDDAYIEFSETFTGSIEVINMWGKRVKVFQVNAGLKVPVNTCGWTPGVYFIHPVPKLKTPTQSRIKMIVSMH